MTSEPLSKIIEIKTPWFYTIISKMSSAKLKILKITLTGLEYNIFVHQLIIIRIE